MELKMRVISLLFALSLLPASLPAAGGESADKVLDALQKERSAAGAQELIRRADIDQVAQARAERIAGLSHDERLNLRDSINSSLREAGITGFRRADLHMDMVRGYAEPAEGFLRSWSGYASAWSRALDPRFEQVGIATHAAADGWVILISIMLELLPDPGDPRELERKTFDAVNEVRRERGLPELAHSASLADVARAHSEDMMRRGYFGHRSPEGDLAQERMKAAGIDFRAVGENIQRNKYFDDPVAEAVRGWMASDGHRKAILDPRFSRSGVGITIDEEGELFFTQLFMRPKSE
jgi:uncharacterized protein YkwD